MEAALTFVNISDTFVLLWILENSSCHYTIDWCFHPTFSTLQKYRTYREGILKYNYWTHKVKCQQLCTHFKWLFITLMDLLGRGILFLFSYESVQDSDGGHKEWHIYLQARWFDKDSHGELLQHAGRGLQWRLGFTVLYCSDAMLLHLHGQCFNRITVVCVWVLFLNCITHATTCKKSLTTIIYLELSQLLCISAFSQP